LSGEERSPSTPKEKKKVICLLRRKGKEGERASPAMNLGAGVSFTDHCIPYSKKKRKKGGGAVYPAWGEEKGRGRGFVLVARALLLADRCSAPSREGKGEKRRASVLNYFFVAEKKKEGGGRNFVLFNTSPGRRRSPWSPKEGKKKKKKLPSISPTGGEGKRSRPRLRPFLTSLFLKEGRKQKKGGRPCRVRGKKGGVLMRSNDGIRFQREKRKSPPTKKKKKKVPWAEGKA